MIRHIWTIPIPDQFAIRIPTVYSKTILYYSAYRNIQHSLKINKGFIQRAHSKSGKCNTVGIGFQIPTKCENNDNSHDFGALSKVPVCPSESCSKAKYRPWEGGKTIINNFCWNTRPSKLDISYLGSMFQVYQSSALGSLKVFFYMGILFHIK